MRCKHCKRYLLIDTEGDLIHRHLEWCGVDPRMCEPSNPKSTVAEELNGVGEK